MRRSPRLITREQAARRLGMEEQQFARLAKSHPVILRPHVVGKKVKYHARDVEYLGGILDRVMPAEKARKNLPRGES